MSNTKNKSQKTIILDMVKEGYKPSQIASLLGYDRSYVYRICRKFNNNDFVHKQGQTCGQSVDKNKNNVHGQRVRFFVHWMSDKYKVHPNTFFKELLPGLDVQCKGRVIYGRVKQKFPGDTQKKVLLNSMSYWDKVVVLLERRLGIVIYGRGKPAYEFTNEEWETEDSAFAVDGKRRGYNYRVYHSDDGKLRLDVNWSDGVPGHETYHFRDGHVDSITMDRFVNSVLDSPEAPSYGELVRVVGAIAEQQREGAAGLRALIDVLRPKDNFPDSFKVEDDYFG